MEVLIRSGVAWIVAVQALGGWLEAPMRALSFLGTEDFYLLVLPLVYWCVDAPLGIKVGFILITGSWLNSSLKLVFAGPRPYWVSAQVVPYAAESTFGVPSGHSQHSVAVWGMLAAGVGRRWAWVTAWLLAFLIGFSRWFLGVHFPHDVLLGWLLGGGCLWAFLRFWDRVASGLSRRSLGAQILTALVVSLALAAIGTAGAWRLDEYRLPDAWKTGALRGGVLPAPVTTEGIIASAGMLFGLAAGVAWLASRGGFDASGPVRSRALRFLIGALGVLVLWMGLGSVFPSQGDFVSVALRYVRYGLVGFWVSAGAPWVFLASGLASAARSSPVSREA
jgi:membrane-associated phospholipid phosphatase